MSTDGPFKKKGRRGKRVVVSFHEEEYSEIMEHAREDDRSLNNFVRLAVLKVIKARDKAKAKARLKAR